MQQPRFLLSFLVVFCWVHQGEQREAQHAETSAHTLLNFVSLLLQGNNPQSDPLLPGYPCTLSVCWHTHTASALGWGLSVVQVKCKWKDVCLRERRQVKLHSGRTRCKRIPCIHNEGHYFQLISLACPRATHSLLKSQLKWVRPKAPMVQQTSTPNILVSVRATGRQEQETIPKGYKKVCPKMSLL